MSTNALSKNFIGSSLAKEEMSSEMTDFHFSGVITICGLVVNMLMKRIQRMLYNFGLPFISIVVLQTIKLSEYVGHIAT
jgi:hypothetical protein